MVNIAIFFKELGFYAKFVFSPSEKTNGDYVAKGLSVAGVVKCKRLSAQIVDTYINNSVLSRNFNVVVRKLFECVLPLKIMRFKNFFALNVIF